MKKAVMRNVISQARNYYMNVDVNAENFTVITAFDKHEKTGVEEVAIVFVDKHANEISKQVTFAQGRLTKEMPISFQIPIIDMLRHEKPILVRFHYVETSTPFFEGFEIFTMREQVGEEES